MRVCLPALVCVFSPLSNAHPRRLLFSSFPLFILRTQCVKLLLLFVNWPALSLSHLLTSEVGRLKLLLLLRSDRVAGHRSASSASASSSAAFAFATGVSPDLALGIHWLAQQLFRLLSLSYRVISIYLTQYYTLTLLLLLMRAYCPTSARKVAANSRWDNSFLPPLCFLSYLFRLLCSLIPGNCSGDNKFIFSTLLSTACSTALRYLIGTRS